jgi:UDP-N-acetylglucosamine 2-epimerase (hydrolysing)
MDVVTGKTISGFSDCVKNTTPDLIVVHGDRVEALAGAIVGSLNNILVAHIEGGEVSGTIDEIIRHSVSKLAHKHFVANDVARVRLERLGEHPEAIHVIGSPDLDVMLSGNLPDLGEVKSYYQIPFESYGVVLFHPVTTEFDALEAQVETLCGTLESAARDFVIIFPNNDSGSEIILKRYAKLVTNPRFKIFPSMRFECFLALLKNAAIVVGNSSAGMREAPAYGVPSLNIGTRQHRRAISPSIMEADYDADVLLELLKNNWSRRFPSIVDFGDGRSSEKFMRILTDDAFWSCSRQKFLHEE